LLVVSNKGTLQRLNALKALLQIATGRVAAVSFAALAPVAWKAMAITAPASVVGGLLGVRFAQELSNRIRSIGIVSYGVGAAIWLFFKYAS
jgi:uncharacterized protein